MLKPSSKMTQVQKEKALTELLGRKVDLSKRKKSGNAEYKDTYLSFKYPAEAVEYKYKDPTFASQSGLLSSFSFDMRNPRIIFNYAAGKRENIKSLSDDPSYTLRSNPARGYKSSEINIDSNTATLFKRDGQDYERSLFLMKDEVEYSFILTGSDPKTLDKLIELISSSLKFSN